MLLALLCYTRCTGVGAYSDSKGNIYIRQEIANFITETRCVACHIVFYH